MAWIARSTDDSLWIFEEKPKRGNLMWLVSINWGVGVSPSVLLPSDADEKLIGQHIDWKDEPVEIQ